jgi:hypothetical protein
VVVEKLAFTVRLAVPLTPPEVAVTVVAPGAAVVAVPLLLIVATVVEDELHAAVEVRLCALPSVNVPVAVNGCVLPVNREAVAGVTAIDTTAGAVTVSVADPVKPPDIAEIVVVPWAKLAARPTAFTVAAAGVEEFQVAVLVTFFVVPSV